MLFGRALIENYAENLIFLGLNFVYLFLGFAVSFNQQVGLHLTMISCVLLIIVQVRKVKVGSQFVWCEGLVLRSHYRVKNHVFSLPGVVELFGDMLKH